MSLEFREIQIERTMSYHFIATSLGKNFKSDNTKYWWKCETTEEINYEICNYKINKSQGYNISIRKTINIVTTLVMVEAAPHRHTSRSCSASTLLGLIYQARIQDRSSIHFISLSGFRGWQKHSLGHPGTWIGLLIKVSFASSNHRGVLNKTPRVKCWLCLLERKAMKQERHPTEMKA